ncbi:hypothetical protein [Flavobacterium soyangense]|uniref:Uncharacterized protein n=1 Tax=Flavobacterium soyangense TaxID=2023265 RepID=A0A930XY45_9FLAO|nr:hypothetical protein [Flavobacterium soyangense]MBF2707448.1 hypothetical protein [Flavobacterium soyangense]
MRIIIKKFFIIIISLFGIMNSIAAPHPPNPGGKKPPPPPGLPIDDGLYMLFIIALLYGIYIIYNHHIKTKTPI